MARIVLEREPQTDDDVIVCNVPAKKPVAERVLDRVEQIPGECWVWPGSTTGKSGYGTVSYRANGKQKIALVHRVAYEALIGEIPEGLELDHLCRVRLCCNPEHLEPVDRTTNSHRGAKYRPTHCITGHEYDEHNMIIRKKTGWIYCRECDRIRRERRKANG